MENTSQMLDLTQAEMLNLWKQQLHLQPVRRDCTVERDDGIDLDALLLTEINRWYAQTLLTAPAELLPVEDMASDVVLTAVGDDGVVTATVPARCVRPVEWRLDGWHRSVTRFLRPDDPAVARQENPWTRGRACEPAIVDHGDHLVLYSLPAGTTEPHLALARCIVRPADGRYRFHASLVPQGIL